MRPLFMPAKFSKFHSIYRNRAVTILDVGCGNHSPALTKRYFPMATYHGLDRVDYNIDDVDRTALDALYRVDLDADTLETIPDDTFDLIIVNHVVEHLRDPASVVAALCRKLRPEGHIYLEFPSLRSLGLPSMEGTNQFCDDPTHVYLPDPYVLANALLANGVRVLDGGTRRDPFRVLASPIFWSMNLARLLVGRRRRSRGLWDANGFAFYLFGVRRAV
jgi:SAM-dependent methyltransferase